jgi:phosphodiesterase/alkaline phosphatase D-like protein
VGGGYAPADLRSAYNLPSESAGSGQTVAIVDAYNDPVAESDLASYRSRYGISGCTTGNGCFRKVNQTGGTSYPTANAGWAVEISLDLDMVSAACPNCHILLVEASSNSNGDLYTAENEAVALGASEVSNSWGSEEESSETSSDSYFHHTGVPITAAAGDSGYEVEYPAASPYVIAAGGTTLTQASNSRSWSETTWSDTGGGCSAYEPKPAWQTDSPLCTNRTNNDAAAVANPQTPVSVADSYKLPSEFSKPQPGWTLVGGTSVSSPLIAGTMALANAYTKSFPGADAFYTEAAQNGTGVLDDVVSGRNGSCGNYLCEAGPGYDGPTGLGSPYGAPVVLPSPPTVVTRAASAVTQTTATLNASVNPNGGAVSECELQYGTTTSYESSASCTPPPGSGSSPVVVSASVGSLAGNTTYHFRVVATNPGGTSKGSDQTLTTLPNPPTVVTKAASAVTQTSTTLNATVNPNGGAVSECELQYGTTTSYASSAPCTPSPGSGTSPVAVSASITSLSANTTYHFRIVATNPAGTSTGSDETFKTPPNPPTVVTGTASSLTQTTATLNATVNPNGGAVSECELQYGTTTSYGSSAPCTPSPGSGTSPVAVSASITSLSANTTYHFRIVATNPGGTSKGSDQTLTTLPNPATVVTKAASAVTQTSTTLNATVNPNGGAVSECELEYGTTTSYGSSASCTPPPGSGSSPVAVSASVGSLARNTTYHFRISATNTGGTSKGSDQTLTTLPNPPTVVTKAASAVTQTTASLNATVNPNGGEVSECELEYGTTTSYGSSAPCSSLPGSGTSPVAVSASITGLSASTTYHFRISGTNPGGTSTGSDETFKTLPNPPTVVTGTASPLTQTTASLNATVDPNGGEVSDCEFQYGTTTTYESSTPCPVLPGASSSTVVVAAPVGGLSAATTYYFRIVAANPGGTSYGVNQALATLAPTTLPQQGPGGQETLPGLGVLPSQEQEPPPVPDAELASTSLTVSPAGMVNVRVTCPAGESSCTGTVILRTLKAVIATATVHQSKKRKAAILTLASGSFRVAGGQVKTLTLRLSAEARKLLAATHLLPARASIVAHDATGAKHTTQTIVTLRALKARSHHRNG